ncbi:MAG: molybdenum cofactor guanylyltransferase MobA [bacterium]|nr:molybdenum cofactor guanylyltransferase MobA [bacterium]
MQRASFRSQNGVVGVLLAGGQARRMGGGDKSLRILGGRTLLRWVTDRLGPQVEAMVLNANGDPGRFDAYEMPVVADAVPGHVGPLAGVLTGMDWASTHAPDCSWIVTAPTDAPFLPADLVSRLLTAVAGADLACAVSNGRTHPVVGLWPVKLRDVLRAAIEAEAVRKVDVWTARYRLATASFDGPVDPFFNANRPEDLVEAERLLGQAV